MRDCQKLSWFAVILMCILVPAVSIVHWIINYNIATKSSNVIRPWLLTYALLGVFTVVYYWVTVRKVLSYLRISVIPVSTNEGFYKYDTKVQDIVNDEYEEVLCEKTPKNTCKARLKSFFLGEDDEEKSEG